MTSLLRHSVAVVWLAVVGSLVACVSVVAMVSADAIALLRQTVGYMVSAAETRDELRRLIIGDVVGVIDGYLLAAMLVVFASGLHALFLAEGTPSKNADTPRWLSVRSVDDLKDRLGRVVMIILVVKFCQLAMHAKYAGLQDLVLLAAGTVLTAGALYLTRPATGTDGGGH